MIKEGYDNFLLSKREETRSFPNIKNIETFVVTRNIMLHPK